MGFGHDGRKSFRANIVENCEGTLFIADRRIRVRLVDESATGFRLSTDDLQPIPPMVDARLVVDGGMQHAVQIRHVAEQDGKQVVGIKRLETEERRPGAAKHAKKRSRASAAKALVALSLVIVSGLALQAAPVRDRLAAFPLFRAFVKSDSATAANSASSDHTAVPTLDRTRPFDFHRYLEDDVARWLKLTTAQRGTLRDLFDFCQGVRKSQLTASQQAYLVFTTQAAMLEQFHADQRARLAELLGRPLTGSALLEDVVERALPQTESKELSEQFGVLLVATPALAAKYGVSDEAAAAVCQRIDAEFQPSDKQAQASGGDANQIIVEVSLRMEKLKADCRTLLLPQPASTKGPSR